MQKILKDNIIKQVCNSKLAPTPPMGWNSWDCFGLDVTEQEVKNNADFMAKHLKEYGWEYVVVDLGWYAPGVTTKNYKQKNIPLITDEYGRLIPVEERFPSSANGKGFKPLADYVHSLGLKFGIHIMKGMPWIAAENKQAIKGTNVTCDTVAEENDQCLWYGSMYGIDCTKEGAQAYYDSLIEKFGNKIVLSVSPGAAYIGNAYHLSRHAHMWRISCDFWDNWEALKRQFPRCAAWSKRKIPGHWPDADMLPLGKIGIRGEVGEARNTNFTKDEQITLMTLWCIFRSPLMFGGDLPQTDEFTMNLITNKNAIEVNQHSKDNKEIFKSENIIIWKAMHKDNTKEYIAIFNIGDTDIQYNNFSEFILCPKTLTDIWNNKEITNISDISIPSHGAILLMNEI